MLRAVASIAAVRSWRVSRVWLPFLVSRVVVWTAGVLAMKLDRQVRPFDPTGLTAQLGHVGNIILAPAVRWDAVWYLHIAQHGYHGPALTAFFPLYPLLISPFAWSAISAVVAGIVISLVAFWVALELIYRFVKLDFGPRAALAAVWLLALFPTSLFFSAVYTESLFLALSAGCLYLARRQRWMSAGVVGAFAAATRNVGVLLVAPLAILYLQQLITVRRERLAGDPHAGGFRSAVRTTWRGLAGTALVPAGLVAYIIGLGIENGTPFEMFNSQLAGRALTPPPVTVLRELRWASHLGRALIHPSAWPLSGFPALGLLAVGLACTVVVWRRLGAAYAAYVALALLVLLSEPTSAGEPMTSFIRYVSVVFPLWIGLALAIHRHWSWYPILAFSTLVLIVFTSQFATWRFVA
jgi:hypothetical protein